MSRWLAHALICIAAFHLLVCPSAPAVEILRDLIKNVKNVPADAGDNVNNLNTGLLVGSTLGVSRLDGGNRYFLLTVNCWSPLCSISREHAA